MVPESQARDMVHAPSAATYSIGQRSFRRRCTPGLGTRRRSEGLLEAAGASIRLTRARRDGAQKFAQVRPRTDIPVFAQIENRANIKIPAVQNPHCSACDGAEGRPARTERRPGSGSKPSTVRNARAVGLDRKRETGAGRHAVVCTVQARTRRARSRTWVPVRRAHAGRKSVRSSRGSASPSTARPFSGAGLGDVRPC